MVDDGVRILITKAGRFLDKAVAARELFYRGTREAEDDARITDTSPAMARMRFAESTVAKEAIADNRWHMAQSRTWSLMAIAKGVYVLVAEQKRTNQLLEENNHLQKEIRNALRSR